MPLNEQRQHLLFSIQDDNIALEEPEVVTLKLGISPLSSCSNVQFSPYKITRVLILDDDGKDLAEDHYFRCGKEK